MLNQRLAAARAVADELFPAEKVLDEAIVHHARLTIAVIEGRSAAKLPLSAGQRGLDLVAQSNARLCEARGLLVEAHRAFRETQVEVGLKAYSWGDLQECPPSSAEHVTAPALSIVA